MTSCAELNRRQVMIMGTAMGAALGVSPLLGTAAAAQSSTAAARADTAESDRIAADFIGAADAVSEGLALDLPALGDNPSAVPVRVHVTEAITDDSWCEELIVLAERNPMPLACRFRFSQASGAADVAVRLRLIETMHVRALARMKDGRVFDTRGQITVAAGGCGL
ncbi:thiosulfate oxidation carrier protein SoxY [Paracoccus sp. IB05]|uniref:thiosulfate oxidation carrier protein SoxY n=1 Tax=Paracoccus sp. IB05 TaxID=2779367 RepID=UPI0018E8CA15|nr:thiosulfate oxidation carrier protein SoxY [Paracoccus sp. IB05]MBJ2151392.1 thiosulfate oxidation carrier protein SoxY [Paracoccus sp. IB05]